MGNPILERKVSPHRGPVFDRQKFSLHSWYTNNCVRYQCSATQQKLAQQVISRTEAICDETSQKVRANRDETNHQLRERIRVIEYWRDELLRNRKILAESVDTLKVYIDRLVASLNSLHANALDINRKCLLAREKRIGIDFVNDNVEKELRKEAEVINCADRNMTEALEQTREMYRRLKSGLYTFDREIEDKENNLRIDRHNLTLKETGLHLSIYQGKAALECSSITIEEWEAETRKNIEALTKEVKTATQFCPHIDQLFNHTIKALIDKKIATDNAYKHRIAETKRAKEKLESQHSEIMLRADEMTRNITQLEKKIAEKEGFMALVHTRLGNRCQRPGMELTRDEVEESLAREASGLREVVTKLQQTLFEAQSSLRFLLKTQLQIEEDINIKTNTLKIDEVFCMSLRASMDFRVF